MNINSNSLIGGGALAAAVGVIIWLWTANAASACNSILVRVAYSSQCSQYTLAHSVGLIAALGGIAAIIIGVVARR